MSEAQGFDPSQTPKTPQLSELTPLPPLPEAEPRVQHTPESRLTLRGLFKAVTSKGDERDVESSKGDSQGQIQRAYNKKDHKKQLKQDRRMGKTTRHANNIAVIEAVYGDGTAGSVNPDHIASPAQIMKPSEWGTLRDRRVAKSGQRKINEAQRDIAEARRREQLANIPEDKDQIKRLQEMGWGNPDYKKPVSENVLNEAYAIHELLNTPTAPKESPVGDPDTESRVEKVVSFVTRVDSDLSKLTGVVLTKNQLTLDDFQYLVRRSNRKATLIDVAKTIDRLETAGIIVETETVGTWKTTITPDEYKLAEKYAFDEIREHKEPSTSAKEENSRTDFAPRSGIDIDVLRRLDSEITEAIRDGVRTAKDEQGLDQDEELTREKFEEIRDSTVERCIKAQLVELDEAIKEDPETLDRRFVLVKGDLSAISARTKRK